MPPASVDAPHESAIWPEAGVAVRLVGAVGGVVSEVAVPLASLPAGPTLPAASSAVTLY